MGGEEEGRTGPMARATGLEPATSGVTGRHSNRLSYARISRLAARGAVYGRPALLSRRSGADPSNFHADARDRMRGEVVGGDGIEPPTLSV